jgi:hypothetical protein
MVIRDSGELWDGQPILCQQEAMLVKGVLFVRGMLTLTSEELSFCPIRVIDKLAGAQDLRFGVAHIEETEGDAQELIVVVEGKDTEFRGRGAGYVLERLDTLLQHRQGIEIGNPRFEKDERILVQGPLESHINALLSARGSVTLSTHRFRFEPDGFLNRMVGAGLAIDVPIDALEAVEVVAVRRLLRLQASGTSYLYAGYLVPSLYSRLVALGVGGGSASSHELLATWEAAVVYGPLTQRGTFIVSASQLTFTMEGRLDSMLSSHTLTMPIAGIERLASRAGNRIDISCEGETNLFEMAQSEERLHDLFALLLQFRDEREPEGTEVNAWRGDDAAATLGRMSPDLVLDEDEDVLLLGPALQWLSEATVRRGVVAVTSNRLLFIPAVASEKRLAATLLELRRVPFGEELTSQLQMLVGRRHIRFTPRGGSSFTDHFWATVEALIGPVEVPETEDEALTSGEQASVTLEFLPRNMGRVKYVSVSRDGRLISRIAPGETLRQPDGFGVFYPGLPSSELEEGADLDIEVGRDDGIYRFTSTLLRIDDSPYRQQEAASPDGVDEVGSEAASTQSGVPLHVVREGQFLLVVQYPDDLRFLNRREGFRVAFDILTRVRQAAADGDGIVTGVGSFFRCTIDDLAVIGCSLRTPREIELGSMLAIEIPLRDTVLVVHGTCIRRGEDDGSGLPALYGFRFQKLRLVDEDTLLLAITRRQRQSLPLRA